ncbi:hypothetical protein TcG_06916 [Trypanosoma cruzi]|uniref:Uncharacterized protein n=1 Tax=Trypanosoma cruzi Dm28c TaxID=1416333 RepID=V5BIC9_TRYCR|nr:hypothetical protein TCDM_05586 [Trypanosoma cruzi Dm28c]PBJ75232.1 hypothetical protein BCY84_11447 [Trypanosoma cruzi cruzi]RNF15713.1 hypothetical protein TcG_06916 [Trypanosoma cruzi]
MFRRLFQTEASDAPQLSVAVSLGASRPKASSRGAAAAESKVKEITVRLLRRLRPFFRTHKNILLGTCGAVVVGYMCQWIRRVCGERRNIRSAQDNVKRPASGWGLRWFWHAPFAHMNGFSGDTVGDSGQSPCCPSGRSIFRQTGEDDDEINFVDATESAFRMFQRRVERTHEAPLLLVLNELESLGRRWQSQLSDTNTALEEEHEEAGNMNAASAVIRTEETVDETLREAILRKAVEADELLTQYVVQMDLAPVGNSSALKKERKASIVAASALAERIAKWMSLPSRHQQP